jgi:hypothetical protein
MERRLERLARKRGCGKSDVIREAVEELVGREEGSGSAQETPFARIADLIGCVSDLPPDLSTRTGERFRELLVRRHRARR